MTVVAAFDVDGTLTTRDCVVPFMRQVRGTRRLVWRCARPALIGPVVRRDRDALKAVGARAAFRDLAAVDVERTAESFADSIVAERLRSDTLERLRWHADQGHDVVLVSASFEVYLAPLAARIGASAALGTRLVVCDDRYTGDLDGPNCRAAEKVRRLHQWLRDHHGGRAAVELYAYGDSAGDRDLLADADHPVWARGPLEQIAPTS